jgi:hypothetical protein
VATENPLAATGLARQNAAHPKQILDFGSGDLPRLITSNYFLKLSSPAKVRGIVSM